MARRGGHVAAVAQVLPQQGRNGLGHVETVRVQRKIELPEERRMLTQPLPKRPHRMQPLDQQIARSLTTARPRYRRSPVPGSPHGARLVLNDAPHTPRTHVDRDAYLPNGRKFAMRNLQLR